MGVPGETTDGGRSLSTLSRRPLAATLTLLAVSVFAYLYAPIPAPNVLPASAGDCVELHLYSNGYHSDIGAPAEIFPEDHPLRRLYPDARTFLVGWGDRAFYASDGSDILIGVDALIPPSPSAFHITYDAAEASAYLGAARNDAMAMLAMVRCPSTVLRARVAERAGPMDFSISPTWPGLAGHLSAARDIHWQDVSHFIPMEQPERLAALIAEEWQSAQG